MKTMGSLLALACTSFLCLVWIIDQSNQLIALRRDEPVLEKDRDRIKREVEELRVQFAQRTSPKILLEQLPHYPHLMFPILEE